MQQDRYTFKPFVESVFHPSDFSEGSESAFAHALAIALMRKTRFTILHAGGSRGSWSNFPAVRKTLIQWGYLEEGSSRDAVVNNLSVDIKKVRLGSRNPLSATLHYLEDHPTDLIVLSTEGREGMPRWIKPSFAERIAEKSETMTLFVPKNSKGFVSPDNGSFTMQRILVPVDTRPHPQPAIISAARIAVSTSNSVEIILYHVGDSSSIPEVEPVHDPALTWKTVYSKGHVVDRIIEAAREFDVNLIVMATTGHDGILDVLRGTITEQVLRRSPSALLAVPCF